ncbi:GAP family protein [Nocardiopsis sp. RSe5-2]|uniref:GAP family protein n=1 Tax=Nocardiopsis endophytica TaxID=3018445 RepID=A0ABT4U592_9ACTN|nr:GAP family protein [Nocardiopsis endophytica]MDA2811610.1 GAP family protein [Nocardiopsis endophytica]
MSLALLAPVLGLALIDSTSFGTLLIPVWLLLAPGRVRPGRMAFYLTAVGGLYFLLGCAIAVLFSFGMDRLSALADSETTALRAVQLVAGAALLLWGVWAESGHRRRGAQDGEGRLRRWRERAVAGDGGPGGLFGLAVTAAVLEVPTLLPFLGAIGLLVGADLGAGTVAAALAAYCAVMVLPAAALTAARVVAHDRVAPLLGRMDAWLERNGRRAMAWALQGLGGYLAVNAALTLFFT